MRIYIYIFEFPNGKYYIGQTKDCKMRWDRHSRKFRANGRKAFIDYAIGKYGWENVKKRVILICSSKMANYFEEKLILKYKTLNRKYGYNLKIGGRQETTPMGRYLKFKESRKPILRYDAQTGFFEKWYPNLLFTAKDNNTTDKQVSQALSEKSNTPKTLHGKIYVFDSYSRKKRLNPQAYKRKQNKFHCYVWYIYDYLNSKILAPCYSLEEVSKLTGIAKQTVKNNVSDIVRNNKKFKKRYFIIRSTAKQKIKNLENLFQEKISSYIPPQKPAFSKKNVKAIEVINKDTKKVLIFNSGREAANTLSLNYKYMQRAASRERRATGYYKGYYFNYL